METNQPPAAPAGERPRSTPTAVSCAETALEHAVLVRCPVCGKTLCEMALGLVRIVCHACHAKVIIRRHALQGAVSLHMRPAPQHPAG